MRGSHFLPIDLGKRQKQILDPNKNNRRVIQYSYNLINNAGNEEDLAARKDISVKTYGGTGAASQCDVYGRPVLATRQGIPERKLSLPSTQKSLIQQNGLKGNESKKVDSTVLSLSRERKTSLNYSRQAATTDCQQKPEESNVQKYSTYRNDRINRYSDPLYEQRSLPPIPYRSLYYGEPSTTSSLAPDILDSRPKLSQFSKSQNSLVTSGTVTRKDGISATENKDIMHGKMRKKAVCDSTDDSYYQRQFLRVLNKRF